MAITLPSQSNEWIAEWRRLLNENDDYAAAGEGWGVGFNGDFLFVIEPDDVYPGDALYFFVGLEDGECTEAYEVDDLDEVDNGFVFRGPYANWKEMYHGGVGPIDGMMSGKFEVEGDMQKVLQYSDAAVAMTENSKDIDTEFEY